MKPAADTFRKESCSNPSAIRQQFIHHVMESNGPQVGQPRQSVNLRPAKKVLSILRHDPTCNLDDYVVGYIDRKSGILEKPVSEWEDFIPEDHIAYFKQVSDDCIVWDRAKKIDRLFSA